MNDYLNTNYAHGIVVRPPGVYFICRRGYPKHYIVRIPTAAPPGVTTICKCKTRAEAEKAYSDRVPEHNGQIPYFECGQKSMLKKAKR